MGINSANRLVSQKNVFLSAEEYDALAVKDVNAFYFLKSTVQASTNKRVVYFDYNGGTGPEEHAFVVDSGTIINVPVPTKTGYTFLGWRYGETAGGTNNSANSTTGATSTLASTATTVTVTSNVIYYAMWCMTIPNGTHAVNWNGSYNYYTYKDGVWIKGNENIFIDFNGDFDYYAGSKFEGIRYANGWRYWVDELYFSGTEISLTGFYNVFTGETKYNYDTIYQYSAYLFLCASSNSFFRYYGGSINQLPNDTRILLNSLHVNNVDITLTLSNLWTFVLPPPIMTNTTFPSGTGKIRAIRVSDNKTYYFDAMNNNSFLY